MAAIEFDIDGFRAAFPAFAQTNAIFLQAYWDTSTQYISNQVYCGGTVAKQTLYLNLMTAHLAQLQCQIASGALPGIVTQSTIDKVTVAIQPPPGTNQWQYWLNLTPFGSQLLALLTVNSVGGLYVTTSPPEINAFRKNYGVW